MDAAKRCRDPKREFLTDKMKKGKNMLRKVVILVSTLALSALLAGCNTAEGIGKDIKSGGAAIEDAAKDVKKKM